MGAREWAGRYDLLWADGDVQGSPWGVRDCRRRLRRPGEDRLQRHRSGARSEPHVRLNLATQTVLRERARGCTCAGEELDNNAVFLVRSTNPSVMTVRQGFEKFDIVAYRDYIFQNRQGLNSLRHTKSDIPAAKPKPVRQEAPVRRGGEAARVAQLERQIGALQAELAALRGG